MSKTEGIQKLKEDPGLDYRDHGDTFKLIPYEGPVYGLLQSSCAPQKECMGLAKKMNQSL